MDFVERYHRGHDNTIQLIVDRGGFPVQFVADGTTLVTIELAGITITSDTDAIEFADGGSVLLKLGQSGVPAGLHRGTLVAYNANKPNGELLFGPETDPELWIEVV